MPAPPSRAPRAALALCALALAACDDIPDEAPSSLPSALAEEADAQQLDAGPPVGVRPTAADGGVDAGTCTLGDRQFATGTTVVCEDGCNRCKCAQEGWSTTLALCAPVPKIERCSAADLAAPETFWRARPLYRKGDLLALALQMPCFGESKPLKLCWTGELLESNPVQMPVRVVTPETRCSSLTTRERVFDLTPLRDAWRESYRAEHGTVDVRLRGSGAGALYTF